MSTTIGSIKERNDLLIKVKQANTNDNTIENKYPFTTRNMLNSIDRYVFFLVNIRNSDRQTSFG